MRIVWAALLVLALSGCASGCKETGPWEARWIQPGVFDALGGPEAPAGVERTPPAGIDLDNASLGGELAAGEAALTRASWDVFEPNEHEAMELGHWHVGSRVAATLKDGRGASGVSDMFRRFVVHFVGSQDARIDDWTQEFLASKTEHEVYGRGWSGYRVIIDVTRAEAFVDGLGLRLRAEGDARELGAAEANGGDWRLAFDLAEARVPPSGNRGWTLRVDALDRVGLQPPGSEPPAPADIEGLARDAFEALGLPAPDASDHELVGTRRICYD